MKRIHLEHQTPHGHLQAKAAAMEAFGLVDPTDFKRQLDRETPEPLFRVEYNTGGSKSVLAIYDTHIISSNGSGYSELKADGSAKVRQYSETGRGYTHTSKTDPKLTGQVANNLYNSLNNIPGALNCAPTCFQTLFKQHAPKAPARDSLSV